MNTNPLYKKYQDEVIPALKANHGYQNPMQVPKLVKVVLNSGVSPDKDRETLNEVVDTLSRISGQKAVITKTTKNISQFKLRAGMNVGASVTLRRDRMYNFLYRLVNIVLPRVRDFRGVPTKSFDGAGNYTFGLAEQSVFTEIDMDKAKHTVGMNITIVTTAKTDDEARDLLALLGMPFAKN